MSEFEPSNVLSELARTAAQAGRIDSEKDHTKALHKATELARAVTEAQKMGIPTELTDQMLWAGFSKRNP